jgi:hypothetical protein
VYSLCWKRWRLLWVERNELPKGRFGDCDPPHVPNKAIRVRKNLPEEVELEALLHEGLHACDWHKDEEWVGQAAGDLARFVYAQGWRRQRE